MQRVPPIDAAFHVIMAGLFIGGFAFANTMGNHMWERRNQGKLFHHAIHTLHEERNAQQRATFTSLETKKEQNPRTGVVGLKKASRKTGAAAGSAADSPSRVEGGEAG
mmetsp:Transcript_1747/g.6161  ORF Transcript_1747/g.6161 Transcript_1747/m.6161 type:complete len:108 (+) Transcript_1747:100-423(+)